MQDLGLEAAHPTECVGPRAVVHGHPGSCFSSGGCKSCLLPAGLLAEAVPAAGFILSADKEAVASLEQKLKEMDEECRVEERRRVDLELSIVEVKDNLKKAEAGPVTLGTTVDTTHLENASPRVSQGAPFLGAAGQACWIGLRGLGHTSLPLTQSSLSPVAIAQSCHPNSGPGLYPSQCCHCAQEQTSVGHGHGQRHRPPESQGKGSLLASVGLMGGQQHCHCGGGLLLTRVALFCSE